MMSNEILHMAAKDLLSLVSNNATSRTINIIDKEGIIIGSTDISLIGKFSQTGLKAVESEAVQRDGQFGSVFPITYDNKTAGAVEVQGAAESVKELGAIISCCLSKLIEDANYYIENKRLKEQKASILDLLYTFDVSQADVLRSRLKLIRKQIEFPVTPVLIRMSDPEIEYEHVSEWLKSNNYYDPVRDVLFTQNNGFLLLRHSYVDTLAWEMKEKFSINRITSGFAAYSYASLITSLHTATKLEKVQHGLIASIANPDNIVPLVLSDNSFREALSAFCWNLIDEELTSSWVRDTISAYVRHEGSVQDIAKELSIHKNTAIYRVNKIVSTLDLENAMKFTQVLFFTCMLIGRKKNKAIE
jgi:Sugar diacid utilization regulator